MLEILRWLLNQKELNRGPERTKDTARNRLQLVLMHDRLDLTSDKMEAMKREILDVVSRYMVVDDEFPEFVVRRQESMTVLVSNIKVRELAPAI